MGLAGSTACRRVDVPAGDDVVLEPGHASPDAESGWRGHQARGFLVLRTLLSDEFTSLSLVRAG